MYFLIVLYIIILYIVLLLLLLLSGNLQSSADLSARSDRPVEVTPTGIVTSALHGLDTGGSDSSVSSREQTDASSVDSLDISSTEKPGSKNPARRSRKNPIFAVCHKRKSVTPLSTHSDAAAVAFVDKSPGASRRCSAPQKQPSSGKLLVPVQTEYPPSKSPVEHKQSLPAVFDKSPESTRRSSAPHSRPPSVKLRLPVQAECPPSKSPVLLQKRLLHACQSAGDTPSPTEVNESHLAGSCGQPPHSATSCGTRELDEVDSGTREAPQTAPVLLQKTDGVKLMPRMSRKIRSYLRMTSKSSVEDQPRPVEDVKVRVVDLSSENVPVTPSVLTMTYSELLQLGRSTHPAACSTNRRLRLLPSRFSMWAFALLFVTVSRLTVRADSLGKVKLTFHSASLTYYDRTVCMFLSRHLFTLQESGASVPCGQYAYNPSSSFVFLGSALSTMQHYRQIQSIILATSALPFPSWLVGWSRV